MDADIIVIGAGPAGLVTACTLAGPYRRVLVLEARDRIGGRILSMPGSDGGVMEAGAEFIHGNLPLTRILLKEAGLTAVPAGGRWVEVKSGQVKDSADVAHWDLLMQKIAALKTDMALRDFLEQTFPDAEYAALKDKAISLAEGYDSADATRASVKALHAEWSREADGDFRVVGGYAPMMEFLAGKLRRAPGSGILLSHPVSAIDIESDGVRVTAGGKTFTATGAVLALPLAVLQRGGVRINPVPEQYGRALQTLGMGDVIKFLFRFHTPFWEDVYPGMGFLLSGAPIPTWWTQAPHESNLLSGWLAGRAAGLVAHMPDEDLRDMAMRSLAQIFSMPREALEEQLAEALVLNWSADPRTQGSYAYATVGSSDALRVLREPIGGRVFFAGEYMYEGPSMGTVEAAMQSGLLAAESISAATDWITPGPAI